MRAGLYNEIISIYKEVSEKDAYGSINKTKHLLRTIKSNVKWKSGNREENNMIYHTSTLTFAVRIYQDIKEDYIIRYKDVDYRILSIEPHTQNRCLNLTCEKIID